MPKGSAKRVRWQPLWPASNAGSKFDFSSSGFRVPAGGEYFHDSISGEFSFSGLAKKRMLLRCFLVEIIYPLSGGKSGKMPLLLLAKSLST
jgi:hypothetical protein